MSPNTVGFKYTVAIDLCMMCLSNNRKTWVHERETGLLESRTQDAYKLALQEIFPNIHSWLERD